MSLSVFYERNFTADVLFVCVIRFAIRRLQNADRDSLVLISYASVATLADLSNIS